MTETELRDEFWLLTKGILQDSRIDADEARVLKRWLEEHRKEGAFDAVIERLAQFLSDGYVDRFESKDVIDLLGFTLRRLNEK